MAEHSTFDYAVIRIVPRVEREEFINAGVILFARTLRYLDARVTLPRERLASFGAALDLEELALHLEQIPRICAGDPAAGTIATLPQHERWHWLVAPRSTILQTSSVHSGLCTDPRHELEHLMQRLVL